MYDSIFFGDTRDKAYDSNKQAESDTLKTLTWNTEGLITAFDMLPNEDLKKFDLIVLTETFLTKEWFAADFYNIHAFAMQGQRGRPIGGITCLLKPRLSPFKLEYKTSEMLVISTKLCTIIAVYFQPEYKEEDIIDIISTGLEKTQQHELVIIAGDMNCRIDVNNRKAETVLQFLEGEGLSLINKRSEKTYVCYNGSSTIDLVLSNMRKVESFSQTVLSRVTRKHLPVATTFILKQKCIIHHRATGLSRTLNTQIIRQASSHVTEAIQYINNGCIDNAAAVLEHIIVSATKTIEPNRRKAKPWFDKTCYQARQATLQALHKAVASSSAEALNEYARKRREYKALIKETKTKHYEEAAKKLVQEAENDPYIAIKQKKPMFPRNIPMETWVQHFNQLLRSKDTRPQKDIVSEEISCDTEPFTIDEVQDTISALKDKKACGPDKIYNEHLKNAAPMLIKAWTCLFNECLQKGKIPEQWRTSKIITLYKGKGDVCDPNSYRGICLENTLLKTLTRLLMKRLTALVDEHIPEEQFGFRKSHSTIQAVECLQIDIHEALRHPKGKLHAVFVDYTKAFDTVNRTKLMAKLENLVGIDNPITRLIKDILTNNSVQIDDMVITSDPIDQTTGVLQGDPLSPLLFNIATHDVVQMVKTEEVKLYMYADDMVLASTSKTSLQIALDSLTEWAQTNDLTINGTKTVAMTFRRGGKQAAADTLYLEGRPLNSVKDFKYLGITLQPQGKTYTVHIKDKVAAAIIAMTDIKHLQKISLQTAMKIFKAKILPVISYGLHIIWQHLTKSNLMDIEKVKATFLKRALCLSKFTPSRLVYELSRETMLLEDLRLQLLLPSTPAYETVVLEHQRKKSEIWENFYTTDAMTKHDWKEANYDMRHLVTRLAVHGFHFKMCRTEHFHEPTADCKCLLCDTTCGRYHILECRNRPGSLIKYCEN